MVNVSQATVKLVYNNKDITHDLQPWFMNMSYTDKMEGEADELEVVLRNDDDRFINSWQPQQGDTLAATIIMGQLQLPCGVFVVDEFTVENSRDSGGVATIKALAAGVKDSIRTKYSVAHEGKTLKQIAVTIATKYNYKVQGIIKDFPIVRVTQFHETDLGFLHRLAQDHGYAFSLRGSTLVFTYYADLNSAANVFTVNRTECIGTPRITDKITGVYNKGHLKHFNSKLKKTFEALQEAGANPSADVYRQLDKVDSADEADYKIGGRLYRKNLEQKTMDITVPGNTYYVCGSNIQTNGWGNYDIKWMIAQSTHKVNSNENYVTGMRLQALLQ